MPPSLVGAQIAALGIQLQLAASLLLFILGLMLRRGIGHRPWVTWWAWSFGVTAVGILALVIRYDVLPRVPDSALQLTETGIAEGLYIAYTGAKLLFLGLLFAGTWVFTTRRELPRARITVGLAIVLVFMVLFVLLPDDLNSLVAWQAAVAIPVFLFCSAMVGKLPAERRTRGSLAFRYACLAWAVLWALYIPAFLLAGSDSAGATGFLGWLTRYNSYIDVLFQFLLGFGMILAVLDDVYREGEAARQDRLNELADSEARLAQIIRAASEGIVLLDAERRVVHCNPAALEILHCEAAQVLMQPFDRFVQGGALGELWQPYAGAGDRLPVTPPGGYEIRGLRADGEEFPMELSLRAVGKTTPEGYVLILRDRTQRARLEEERDRMQSQLAQAARLETIGRMISGVAHELNNPLTAILAFAQDLLGQPRNAADSEALSTIVQQSQRCRAIVQDLLTFARTKREDRQSVSLAEIARRVLPAFERLAASQPIRLETRLAEQLPLVHANPAALEQVLANLLSNAFQAAGPGGHVTVTTALASDQVVLIVEDDGPGIPAEVLPRLFEPFFTTKDAGEGTGLGLSVSHGIVEQHGGTLRAENRGAGGPRKGARFTVGLPFLDRRSVRREPIALPRSELSAPSSPVGPSLVARRLLIVDDEAAIRTAIRRFLERRGWQVEEAANGTQALERLGLTDGAVSRCETFDAIVTDLRMPGVSGIEIHDRLAARNPAALSKLVVISGDTASAEIAAFLNRLRQPIIQKPFDMRALADLLDRTAPPRPATTSS